MSAELRVMPKELHEPIFDLNSTLCCGQAFRWDKQGEWWFGIFGQNACKIRQKSGSIEFEGADDRSVNSYFRLSDDMLKILSNINRDKHIKNAIVKFKGLRILRQEPWECLISYICATYKNIPAIKNMLNNLSRKFGEEIHLENHSLYVFPSPTKLANASLHSLEACSLGYRAKYVSETAKKICDNALDLESLKKKSYDEARRKLLELPGVGPKVADCVLLFSLEKLEAFPVDLWIKRAILKYYAAQLPRPFVERITAKGSLSDTSYGKLSSFGRQYFGKYAGYAQEYLYHYERTST